MNDNQFAIHLIGAKPGLSILELGIEYGKSTMLLAALARKNDGHVTAVDHWQGNPAIREQFMATYQSSPYHNFLTICEGDLFEKVDTFKPESFDVIYFDAVYSYPEARLMLEEYLLKAKKRGLLIGHGADFYWTYLPADTQKVLRLALETNKQPAISCQATEDLVQSLCLSYHWERYFRLHPEMRKDYSIEIHAGLSLALFDVFNDLYKISAEHTIWWWYND